MLECVLGGSQKWHAPPVDVNTLFYLAGFASVNDVVDRSKNNIAVSKNGSFIYGVDSIAPYIQFTGTQWLAFTSSLLNKTNIEVVFAIGDMPYVANPYSAPLLDTRPDQTNGNYHILTILNNTQTTPWDIAINYPTANSYSYKTTIGKAKPTVIRMQLRAASIQIWVDGKLAGTVGTGSTLDTTNMKIGKSGFDNAVPKVQCKLYYLEVRNLTT